MNPPLEERLRAHFADRAANEPVPPPDLDRVMARRQDAQSERGRWSGTRRDHRRPWLLAAAACLVVVVAAASAIALRDDTRGRTVTGESPEPVPGDDTPPRPTTTEPPSTSVPGTNPSTGASAATTPDESAAPSAGSSGRAVVVALEGVLGWWDGDGWVRADSGAPPPARAGDEYRIVRLDDAITTATGSGPTTGCGPGGDDFTVDVGLRHPEDRLAPTAVAVSGVADPRPRSVSVLDPRADVYRSAAVAVLADLGVVDDDPDVVQVVRGDLEGDGVDEVFVAVQRVTDPATLFAAPGDYSVIFVRRVVGGEVLTSVLAQSIAPDPQPPEQTPFVAVGRISALADLNSDGRMEVVTHDTYYEGTDAIVHEAQAGGGFVEVLSAGCGA